MVGCSSHYIIYMDDTIFYAAAQSERALPVDLGAGAQCGGLPHSLFEIMTGRILVRTSKHSEDVHEIKERITT